jgi:DNA adenine methylase
MSFFRYPGGKKKIKDVIIKKIASLITEDITEYREPFFGGGSIGIEFLTQCSSSLFNKIHSVWINDFDVGVACLWTSVIRHPEELKEKIKSFTPSTSNFYEFKDFLTNLEKYRKDIISPLEIVDIGFKKIAIHQISYSGLGTMSGSPLGGHNQKSDYKIDCRWSPDYLCRKIDKLNKMFNSFSIKDTKCSAHDFCVLLANPSNSKSVVYLDPPYFDSINKKFNLYQHAFNNEDHTRLCKALKETKHKWVLSYNNCQEIKSMYSWAKIEEVNIEYSISGIRNKKELLISL